MSPDFLFFPIFRLGGQILLLDKLMIFSAVYLIYILFIIAFYGSLKDKKSGRTAFLLSLISIGVGIILTEIIRVLYFEQRPFITYPITPLIPLVQEASFPSKHTLISFCVAFSYLSYRLKIAKYLIGIAVLIGVSRVYVGVHYPVDILGGIAIAAFSVLGVFRIWRKI